MNQFQEEEIYEEDDAVTKNKITEEEEALDVSDVYQAYLEEKKQSNLLKHKLSKLQFK